MLFINSCIIIDGYNHLVQTRKVSGICCKLQSLGSILLSCLTVLNNSVFDFFGVDQLQPYVRRVYKIYALHAHHDRESKGFSLLKGVFVAVVLIGFHV